MKEGGKKVVDVYAEVGFKNPSHFSTALKNSAVCHTGHIRKSEQNRAGVFLIV